MANELSPPFKYADYLIGEEIILRALNQQEDHARDGKYSSSWSNSDRIEQSGVFFRSTVLRDDFDMAGFQHCVPEPPCPWDKEGHDLTYDQFNDIIMSNDGIFTHRFEVFKRTDSAGQDGYQAGAKLLDYTLNQNELKENVRSEFSYYQRTINELGYRGPAVIKIERLSRGRVDNSFEYLFNFIG